MSHDVHYPLGDAPEIGDVRQAAPGIFWLRMPLPFKLNHINLWLLEDGDGWTVVDTGIDCWEARSAWEKVAADRFDGKPLKRMIVTHYHPDHVGLAGWLSEQFGAELWMPFSEWAMARVLGQGSDASTREAFRRFYHAAGFGAELMLLVPDRSGNYAKSITPVPPQLRRIGDGETLSIGGRGWRVITGAGHSYEHASLYCADLRILIAGDQVLPQITPNISVWPAEPDADPLRAYLDSLDKFRDLPEDTLVLPGHRRPFTGLPGRLDALAHHHDDRLSETLELCGEPRTGLEVLRRLFDRPLDDHQVFFAIGESLAHLHFLMGQGRLARRRRDDGIFVFERKEACQGAAG